MILDHRQTRWAVFTAASAVGLLVVYVAYVLLSANGARGGSAGIVAPARPPMRHQLLLVHLPFAVADHAAPVGRAHHFRDADGDQAEVGLAHCQPRRDRGQRQLEIERVLAVAVVAEGLIAGG